MTFASVLGGNILSSEGGLAITVASGSIHGIYNSPIDYGTIIKFPGYYNVFLCISNGGDFVYVSGDSHGGQTPEELVWKQITTT